MSDLASFKVSLLNSTGNVGRNARQAISDSGNVVGMLKLVSDVSDLSCLEVTALLSGTRRFLSVSQCS